MAAQLRGRCERHRSQIAKTDGSFEVELVFRGVSPNGWEICSPIRLGMVIPTRLEKRKRRGSDRTERLRSLLEKVNAWCGYLGEDPRNRQKELALREGITTARVSQLLQLRELQPDLRQQLIEAPGEILEKLSVRKLIGVSRQPRDAQKTSLVRLGLRAE